MKMSPFAALLKNDSRIVWPVLFLSAFLGYLDIKEFKHDGMFELTTGGGSAGFAFVIPYMLWLFLFSNGNPGLRAANVPTLSNLEFMFSRAISRVTLFHAKTTLFLLLCLLPLVLNLGFSFTDSVIRVELPYNTLEHREGSKQFYLTHFEGAYLQEPDTGKNEDYVVLPKGRVDEAACGLLVAFAGALFFQSMMFFFRGKPSIGLIIFFILMVASPFSALAFDGPSPYEITLAWMTQHPVSAFSALGLLAILSQLYCCRRFVNTEITS